VRKGREGKGKRKEKTHNKSEKAFIDAEITKKK
jgi:hypothetical protein